MNTQDMRDRLVELVQERKQLYDRLDEISREATQLTQQITNSQITTHGREQNHQVQ